ncbi:MAG TPA: hypothetical protein VFT43_09290 [Candidatus Polarisedimenticolia bacterium]|nr:hypothetical protein [Candidatus Polarisedimenticolia bacterium]
MVTARGADVNIEGRRDTMTITDGAILERLTRLEGGLRRWRLAALGILLVAGTPGLIALTRHPGPTDRVLRARALIIEDARGHDRILLGAPLPDPRDGERRVASTGLAINDADGYERVAVGSGEDGSVSMGFDAPPGVGDPRNRERANLIVSGDGLATFRVLDGRTAVPLRIYTDPQNRAWLEFLDFPKPDRVVRRRIGFSGEERLEGID